MISAIASPFQVPVAEGVLCVILEAAFETDFQNRIAHTLSYSAERCIPLLEGTRYSGLQANGAFVLACPNSGQLSAYAGQLLENTSAGCVAYLSKEHSLEHALEHWRSLLTVRTDETPAQMMRFSDPRWLEPLLPSLNEVERAKFMGPVTDLAWRNERGWRHYANPSLDWPGKNLEPGWLQVSGERRGQLNARRLSVLAEHWAAGYRSMVTTPDLVDFVIRQLQAAQQAGYSSVEELERWLRVALILGEGFWSRSLANEILNRADLPLHEKLIAIEQL